MVDAWVVLMIVLGWLGLVCVLFYWQSRREKRHIQQWIQQVKLRGPYRIVHIDGPSFSQYRLVRCEWDNAKTSCAWVPCSMDAAAESLRKELEKGGRGDNPPSKFR